MAKTKNPAEPQAGLWARFINIALCRTVLYGDLLVCCMRNNALREAWELLARTQLLIYIPDDIADALEILGLLIGNLDVELILNRHNYLNRVERVGFEILHQVRVHTDDRTVSLQLFYNDFFYLFKCHGRYLQIFAQTVFSKLAFPNTL
jgi:hypothetical protein